MGTPSLQILVAKFHFPLMEPGILGEMNFLGSGQAKFSVSLDNLVPESKEVF